MLIEIKEQKLIKEFIKKYELEFPVQILIRSNNIYFFNRNYNTWIKLKMIHSIALLGWIDGQNIKGKTKFKLLCETQLKVIE